jgi:hypothetical protein
MRFHALASYRRGKLHANHLISRDGTEPCTRQRVRLHKTSSLTVWPQVGETSWSKGARHRLQLNLRAAQGVSKSAHSAGREKCTMHTMCIRTRSTQQRHSRLQLLFKPATTKKGSLPNKKQGNRCTEARTGTCPGRARAVPKKTRHTASTLIAARKTFAACIVAAG